MNVKKALLALSAMAAAAAAFAQGALGTVTQVQGIATVTNGTSGAAVAPGAPILHGSRVITTSTGSVTLRLASGCTLTVPPGHALTVLSTMTCQQLAAATTPVATTTSTAPVATNVMGQAGANAGVVNGVILGTGAAIMAAIVYEVANDDDDEPLSGQ